ncbi:MAG TPA: FKBP-type peptidyl-prolyl cis-trans isomerase [Brumimicrobium sp.]|nr:FKBP-type peptidyl-prolyl cis-trans isomerase [Brumimicrobium sp.]
MKKSFLLLLSSVLLFGTSCKKNLSPEEQFEKDIKIIKEYIADKSLNAEETNSGLHYVVLDEGTGNFPYSNDDVTVRYKGYTTNGNVFDQSDEEGITFNLQQVIKGWTQGITKFKEGGKGILLIPSKLAYGEKGAGSIKPNTVLIFDVDLLMIVD